MRLESLWLRSLPNSGVLLGLKNFWYTHFHAIHPKLPIPDPWSTSSATTGSDMAFTTCQQPMGQIFWYSHCQMEKNAPQIIAVDENVHWYGCVTRSKGSWHHPGWFIVALNILSHYEISPASDLSASLEMKLGWVLQTNISIRSLRLYEITLQ